MTQPVGNQTLGASEPASSDLVSDYTLNVRSYAPFVRFGGGFEGDSRGPSMSPLVTSRIAVRLVFNPQTGNIGKPAATSSGTKFLPLGTSAMGEPRATLARADRLPDGFLLALDVSGANPLVPGAPDIDLHVTLRISLSMGSLNVLTNLRGDRFPNAEVFITDGAGRSQMIVTYETPGGALTGPTFRLPGDRRLSMSGLCAAFPVDTRGHFR